MRKEVVPGIYDGDELEFVGNAPSWIKDSPIRAFYSELYTQMRSHYITIRIGGMSYNPDDCHSYSAKDLRLKEQPYDPTQAGDTDEDI